MMNGSRFGRGSKGRLLLYVGAVVFLLVLVYVFREAHLQVNDARSLAEKCFQQQESLSAQFQVILEYKTRLEMSLQSEKSLHLKTREELQKAITTEQELRKKQKSESLNHIQTLQQEYKLLQSHSEDLQQEFDKLSENHLKLVEDKNSVDLQLQNFQSQKQQSEHEIRQLKSEVRQLQVANEQNSQKYEMLLNELQRAKATAHHYENEMSRLQKDSLVQKPDPQAFVINPKVEDGVHKAVVPISHGSSTEAAVQQQAPHLQHPSSSAKPSSKMPEEQFSNSLVLPPDHHNREPDKANENNVIQRPQSHQSDRFALNDHPVQFQQHGQYDPKYFKPVAPPKSMYGLSANAHGMQYVPYEHRNDHYYGQNVVPHPQHQQLARPDMKDTHAQIGHNYFVPFRDDHMRDNAKSVQRREVDVPAHGNQLVKPNQLWYPVHKQAEYHEEHEPDDIYEDGKRLKEDDRDDKGKDDEIPRVPAGGIPIEGEEGDDDLDQIEYDVKVGNIRRDPDHGKPI